MSRKKSGITLNYNEVVNRIGLIVKIKSETDLANQLEITPQSINNFKKDNKLPVGTVLKFAKKYDVSYDWLLDGIGDIKRLVKKTLEPSEAYIDNKVSLSISEPSTNWEELLRSFNLKQWLLAGKPERRKEECRPPNGVENRMAKFKYMKSA